MLNAEGLIEVAKKGFVTDEYNHDAYVARYAWINSEGEVIDKRESVCHAGLNAPKQGDLVAIISQIMGNGKGSYNQNKREWLEKDLQKKYYHWMMNESPLSQVFITKDVDQVFEDKLVLLDTEQPRNTIMAACMMHRAIWEEIKVPRVWSDLVDAGLDKDGAFFLAHFIYIGYEDYKELGEKIVPISGRSINNNHNIFGGFLYKRTLTNFKNHKPVRVNPETYHKEALKAYEGYRPALPINTMFSPMNKVDIFQNVHDEVCKYLDAPVGTDVNPFNYSAVVNTFRYKDVIQAFAKAYPTILEEDAR